MRGLLTNICCLVVLASAAPTKHEREAFRSVRPFSRPETTHSTGLCLATAGGNGTNATAAQYSSNWAGAVITDDNVTTVTGIFTVPRTSPPAQNETGVTYGAAAWVGIDGWTCGSAILQTGVSMTVQDGEATYSAWYEWFPDYMRTFSTLDVGPGDQIKAMVEARSTTSGTATLENLTTGKKAKHTWKDASDLGALCQANAEWIVEDFSVNGGLIPFADFGKVRFDNASYTAAGESKGLRKATVVDIAQNDQTLAKCRIEGGSAVECTFEG